jgi:predicted DNA-binding antitoxin AbrB/MazE fold protein
MNVNNSLIILVAPVWSRGHWTRQLGILEVLRQAPMTIAAKYEDGVFKPLEDVKLTEGTRVDVHVREAAERPPLPKSLRDLAAFGMWADRDDIPDGVTYVDRLRERRF